MIHLPANLIRPANLRDVESPGVLLKTGRYGASFLVVGPPGGETAIFLDGDYRFQSFPLSKTENWSGLAVEGVQFELSIEDAYDLVEFRLAPGVMIRRETSLCIAVAPEGRFVRGLIEAPIQVDLPKGSDHSSLAFPSWRAFVKVEDERRVVWDCSIARQS